MSRLLWGAIGSRYFEAGADRGVFYPAVGPGVAWNGLVQVDENTEDTGERVVYVDGIKQTNQLGIGVFAASIEAFTYPPEFLPYDGTTGIGFSGQRRNSFGFSYRSRVGNDVKGSDLGYLLHIVYNALATPTSRDNNSLNTAADPNNFTWDISTVPVAIPDFRNTSHLILDSRTVLPVDLAAIEDLLYGTTGSSPTLPTLTAIFAIFETNALYKIVDHGDGTWTATGPDSAFLSVDANYFVLDWPAVEWLDANTYEIRSF